MQNNHYKKSDTGRSPAGVNLYETKPGLEPYSWTKTPMIALGNSGNSSRFYSNAEISSIGGSRTLRPYLSFSMFFSGHIMFINVVIPGNVGIPSQGFLSHHFKGTSCSQVS